MAQKSSERVPIGMLNPTRRVMASEVHKDYATLEKYSRETNGEYSRFVGGVKPGGGNPLHYHTLITPTFTCTSGALGLEINGQTSYLQPGEHATVPIGTAHRFFNPASTTEDCNFTVEVRPGLEGYEQFLMVMFGLAKDGLCDEEGTPKDKLVLATLLVLGDM